MDKNRQRSDSSDFLTILGEILIGMVLLVAGVVPAIVAFLIVLLGYRFAKLRSWYFAALGLVAAGALWPVGGWTRWVGAFESLFTWAVDGMAPSFGGVALGLLPAGVSVGLIVGAGLLWLVRRRPHWLRLPLGLTPRQAETPSAPEKPLQNLVDPEDGVALGVTVDSKNPVFLTDAQANHHVFIAGSTGTGKTNTVSVILSSAIRRGRPVIVVDGKGDPGFLAFLRREAEAAGRPFRAFTAEGTTHYNPLAHGNPTQLKDRVILTETWTEPYYRRAAERYLQWAFRLLQALELRPDLPTVAKLLDPEELLQVASTVGNPEAISYLESLDGGQRAAVSGLRDRLAMLVESDFGPLFHEDESEETIQLIEAVKNREVVVFSLPGLSLESFVPTLGAMIVEDLKAAAAHLAGQGGLDTFGPTYVVLDEFNLFVGPQVVGLVNKTRFAGFCNVLATQELSDVSAIGGEDLVNQLFANTGTKIIHRQDAPESAEYMSRAIGTQKDYQQTLQTVEGLAGKRPTTVGTVRDVETFRVHPNTLKSLRRGEAIVLSKIPQYQQQHIWVRPATRETAANIKEPATPAKRTRRKLTKPFVVRLAVWAVLAVILLKGLISIFVTPVVTAKNANSGSGAPSTPVAVETAAGAGNFAVHFAGAWLSYDLGHVKDFLAQGYRLPGDALVPPPGDRPSVLGGEVYDQYALDDQDIMVVTRMTVVPPGKPAQDVYLAVPVRVDHGRYGVTAPPTYLPAPGRATAPSNYGFSMWADAKTSTMVQQVITSFFRQYATGQPGDLAVLFADAKPRTPLTRPRVEYVDTKQIEVDAPHGDTLNARGVGVLRIDGAQVEQPFRFTMRRVGDHWLIDSTIPTLAPQPKGGE